MKPRDRPRSGRAVRAALVALSLSATTAHALPLCEDTAGRLCAFDPSWGVIEPDRLSSSRLNSPVNTLPVSPYARSARVAPSVLPLVAAINRVSFDRSNRIVSGEPALRGAVSALRLVEPRRPLMLQLTNSPAGAGTAAKLRTRMAAINGLLLSASPEAPIAVKVGRR